jgi:3-isopropylmalate/(R)-2-methylmalate dehydratase large subunit
MKQAKTLLDKVWEQHVVAQEPDCPAILYVDLHLIHEVTSPQAFAGLEARGLSLRAPERTLATMDHSTPTTSLTVVDAQSSHQLAQLQRNCRRHGVTIHVAGSRHNGIVHVMSPELGCTQPGMTIVCGDSHTSTHGAFGALAFGIGTTEVEHVLATQCLLQHRPDAFEVRVDGQLDDGVTAKDLILALIAKLGTAGGAGCVFEYRGEAIRALDMEARMTVCNMSIEAGARAGMIAPDETTYGYLYGKPEAPRGDAWDAAVDAWRQLYTDDGASFARSITLDARTVEPMITYGTTPAMGIPLSAPVPTPHDVADPAQRKAMEKALDYMRLEPGKPLAGHKVDVVFLGSCTNGRLSDLREAARVLRGRKVSQGVRMLVVPGSAEVKRQAESEGLDQVFTNAGAEWRDPGCSMCIAMNGDQLSHGQYAVSTSNRNFEGRQGRGGKTFLASPITAAASAIRGELTDAREFCEVAS